MSGLSAVVRQLKKERANAQQLVARLDAALRALNHLGTGNSFPRRRLSVAARRKIAAAQRARWAKVKRQKAS
ncbi:MAG: hypothetical protein DMG89_14740 [Acidobacteria bacterium]|nr:MAG: hypothetical protein DMG89_14740 [Acidobacteriota bacterium]